MQASPSQIETLVQLQELDRARIQAELQLKEMPHRAHVLEGRQKRKEVQAKFDQVSALLAEAKAARQKLLDEDERLVVKQQETQEKINEESEDYRKVTALTRELETMHKRRETLEFQGKGAEERVHEIQKVYDSASAALEALAKREEELVADYQAKTDELTVQAKQNLEQRRDLITSLPEDIVLAYEEALKKCGGIGLAHLRDQKCSACRSTIDANRLLQIKKEAPLSSCPSCKRLLIVE